eukprot:898105-Prymnesium_polylepis.1
MAFAPVLRRIPCATPPPGPATSRGASAGKLLSARTSPGGGVRAEKLPESWQSAQRACASSEPRGLSCACHGSRRADERPSALDRRLKAASSKLPAAAREGTQAGRWGGSSPSSEEAPAVRDHSSTLAPVGPDMPSTLGLCGSRCLPPRADTEPGDH